MRVLHGIAEHGWEEEMARAIDPRRLSFHADGMSMAAVLRDVVRAAAGESIVEHPVLPSQEEALGITGPSPQPVAAPPPAGPPMVERAADSEPPSLKSLRLSPALTARLEERARREGTTVHGAICSAVVAAGRTSLQDWQEKPVRLFSNINTRRSTAQGSGSAMYFLGGTTAMEPGAHLDFWNAARQMKQALLPSESREVLQGTAQALTNVASQRLDPGSAVQFLCHAFGFDMIVFNVGKLPFPAKYGALHLRSIWGSAFLTGLVGEQTLGVTTVDGCLHLLYTTYTPISALLENVERALEDACA